MFRGILLLLALAFVSAKPNVGMFEKKITEAMQKIMAQFDPYTIASVPSLKIDVEDTSLEFSLTNLVTGGMGTIECTKFSPPILSKKVKINMKLAKVTNDAEAYTAEGTLDGAAFSGAGAASLNVNDLDINLQLKAESYSLTPISLCVGEGSLNVDLVLGSLEANFENGDALNDVLNSRGPELVEMIQDAIMKRADDIVALLNKYLCKA